MALVQRARSTDASNKSQGGGADGQGDQLKDALSDPLESPSAAAPTTASEADNGHDQRADDGGRRHSGDDQ